ncbi:MAG: hypothetical protein ACK5O7_04585 [Holosporales bacterium]
MRLTIIYATLLLVLSGAAYGTNHEDADSLEDSRLSQGSRRTHSKNQSAPSEETMISDDQITKKLKKIRKRRQVKDSGAPPARTQEDTIVQMEVLTPVLSQEREKDSSHEEGDNDGASVQTVNILEDQDQRQNDESDEITKEIRAEKRARKLLSLTQEQYEELATAFAPTGCEMGYYRCSGSCWRVTREWWFFASGMFGLLAGGIGSFGSLLTLDETHRSYLGYASAAFTFFSTGFAALGRFAESASSNRQADMEHIQEGRLKKFMQKWGFAVPKTRKK